MPLTSTFQIGSLRCHSLDAGLQRLDGGAMFGVVPKPLWEKRIAPDARNRIPLAMRPLLVEHPDGLVLIDNGRTRVLADEVGRGALACIRCSACLNVCPVYERTGGHAYGSIYPGPIGAILTPQLVGIENAPTLPYASSLCGACYEVCPVKIDIPDILVHLRGRAVEAGAEPASERVAMRTLARTFASRRAYESAQRLGRGALRLVPWARVGPLRAWGRARDLPSRERRTFRGWWRAR